MTELKESTKLLQDASLVKHLQESGINIVGCFSDYDMIKLLSKKNKRAFAASLLIIHYSVKIDDAKKIVEEANNG